MPLLLQVWWPGVCVCALCRTTVACHFQGGSGVLRCCLAIWPGGERTQVGPSLLPLLASPQLDLHTRHASDEWQEGTYYHKHSCEHCASICLSSYLQNHFLGWMFLKIVYEVNAFPDICSVKHHLHVCCPASPPPAELGVLQDECEGSHRAAAAAGHHQHPPDRLHTLRCE